ncbi:hypothetical protein [Methylobacterium oxalidis]|uniref:Uncharacterized protein n=1 Tax=Methylobacterium oxalidis TaxID=944322 RepID=A0A512J262_9HYPH|nr:hypothetical protein [Methylobacterium oxalidis]GEP04027.1 hypothetical protein MOX02_20650 [Methylobacterium oxalidis]GJE34848.1 hypothetical protein LDDCCGHA_5063 [Methylobacterium oxalidis]GLS64058.1 hypothetical protein GCM10007888_24390 [Methylobacterium oxalidis]
MGLFDDVPDAPQAASGAAPAKKGGLFDDVPEAKAAEPSILSRAASTVGDVVQAAGAGLIKGAAGAVDLPQTLYGLADAGAGAAARGVIRAFGGTPNSDLGVDTRSTSSIPSPSDLPKPGETAIHGLEAATQPLYKPQTVAGEYAGTIAEFLPGAGVGKVAQEGAKAVAKQFAKHVSAPAVASETAGQATKGTELEPWARGAAGLATGVGIAVAGRPGAAERIFDRSAGKLAPDEFGQVQRLMTDAQARGVDLSWPQALQKVVGPRRMGDVLRVVEGEGGLAEFFTKQARQIEDAGRAGLDTIAPAGATPSQVGESVQAAARAGVAGTPEGQAVIRATQAAGPRVTPDQAGQVIQREMRGVADAREAARQAQANPDYAAARAVPEEVGVERTVTVERPGEPVVTQPQYSRPQFTDAAPRPLDPPPTVEAGASAGPESLARFIARNGGIDLGGDARATDLHRFNIPGLGNVSREGGKSIDNFWREHLIEHGYLKPDADGGAARDITNELLRKLQNEQRGVPSYPIGAERQAASARSQAGQVLDEYRAALSQAESRLDGDLARAGVDPASVHPDIRERVLGALMRGEEMDALAAYERTVGAMREPPAPLVKSTTVTEEIPDVRFGQVNPQNALDAIDEQLRTAKGDVRRALQEARRDLFGPGGETDLTVEGLLHARERLDQQIDAARDLGDKTKVRDLEIARRSLDGELKAVPEVATADRNFAANSRPLEPFAGNTPLGRVVQQDPRTSRMAKPAEQVPGEVQGATAAREFLANATPEARRAFEGRQVTRILDEVSGSDGGATEAKIQAAIRQNEDLLSQIPEARAKLTRLANAHQAREAIERSPLGRIAKSPKVKEAIAALFPSKPVEGSAREVDAAVSAVARSNPLAAQQLVRTYLGTEFAEATQKVGGKPNQTGGARFATAIRGNGLQRESLEAAVRALPNGEAINSGFSRLLDIMEATGERQAIGSKTTFNTALREELKDGGLVKSGAGAAATGGLKLPSRIMARLDEWQAGKNVDRLAELMTSAEGGRRLAQLANAKPGASTIALLDRLTRITARAAQSGNRASGAEGEPLQLTVHPSQ